MAISSSATPLFEPGAPPVILPMPTAHTDIRYYNGHQPPLMHEELPPFAPASRQRPRPRHRSISAGPEPQELPPLTRGSKQRACPRRRSTSATPEPPRGVRFDTPLSQSSSDLELPPEQLDDQDDGKIPKPVGVAGRPGSGGYNLERSLAWRKNDFKRLKVCLIVVLLALFLMLKS